MNPFKTLVNFKTLFTVFLFTTSISVYSQTTINCVRNGDWDDPGCWDLGRTPQSGDDVHIVGNTVTKTGVAPVNIADIHLDNSATMILNYSTSFNVSGEIHLDNRSDLEVYCPTSCHDVDMDNRSTICLHAPFTVCYLNINNRSNFWGNGNDVTITNCTNISNPIYVHNQSNFGLDKDCSGNYVGAGTLIIKGNVSLTDCSLIYKDITISNGTLDFGSCNVTILGKVTLNSGGDLNTIGSITYGSNAQLVFNRSYTLNTTEKVWATGTGTGVPPVVTIDSGVITTTDTFSVLRRINLLGGIIGTSSATKIKLSNDTEYVCGGRFQSTPAYGNNVVILTCSPIIISLVSQTNETYYGGSTGSVTLTATAGVSPYSWSKDGINFQSSPTFNGLIAGTYIITCKDLNGVRAAINVTITQPAQLVASITSQTNETYYGGSTGSVTLKATGGVSPYTWSKDGINFQSSSTFSGLTAGTYTFTCKDANSITAATSTTITQPAQLVVSVVSQTNETYYGGSTGSATLSASGGISPYKWSKDGINYQTSSTFSGLLAGTYTFNCKDSNNYIVTKSLTITQPAQLVPSVVSQTNETYYGGSTGSVTLTATGGVSPYTWSKDGINFQSSSTFSGLTAGTYTFTCKDANSITATTSTTITQPAQLVVSVVSQTNETYYGGSTGSVTLSASGGISPYKWSKDGINYQTSSTFSGLLAGTYTFSCKDSNNYIVTKSLTITQPAQLVPSIVSQTNVGCFGASTGSITAAASGGISPYTWSKDGVNFQTSSSFSGLLAGTYTISCKDANSYVLTKNVSITQPSSGISISIISQTDVLCYWQTTGSVTLAASGGTGSFTWSKDGINFQSSATFSSLSAGTYTITAKDANGCTANYNVTINRPAAPFTTAISSQSNVGCYGTATGAISMSGSGGVSPYIWSKDGTNYQTISLFTGLTAGSYIIKGKDANGCTETKFDTIKQPSSALTVTVGTQTNIACYGSATGAISLNVVGGTLPYTYSWSNSAVTPNISGLSAGTYTATVTDANGCFAALSVTITQPTAALITSVGSQTNATYYGASNGSVSLSTAGGTAPYLYLWSNSANTSSVSGLTAGTYSVIITDVKGCTTSKSITITQPAQLIVSISSQTNVSCYGASSGGIIASASGGVSPYTWSKDGINYQNSATFSGLSVGTYTISCKDANNYVVPTNATITQPAYQLSASITANGNCISGNTGSATAATAGGSGTYTYLWNTSPVQTSSTANGLSAGTYSVTVTDANGCSTSKSITISGTPQDFAFTTNYQTTTQSLLGNSFTFTEFGSASGEIYHWDFGDGTSSTLSTPTKSYSSYGVYNAQLIATNTSGCSDTSYQTVVVLSNSKSISPIPVCSCGSNPTVVAQTIIFPTSTTDWSGTNLKIKKAAKFNSALGTLTGVKIITNGSFTTHNKVEITGSMATGTRRLVSIQTTGTMDCGGPGFLYGINPASILDTFYSTGYDGIKDFAGTSGYDFGYHTSSIKDSTSFTDAATLASYSGTDSLTFTAYTNTNMSASFPTGNDTAVMQTVATDSVTLLYYYCNTTISSIKKGNWDDPTTWDLGRIPTACDNVHIRNTDSITVTPTYHASCANILCDGRSKLYIYDTLDCREFINDSISSITKVFGQLNICSMTIDHGSNVYACSNISFSNCTNKANPLAIYNSGHLNPLGGSYCSSIAINLNIDSGNVDLTGLCAGNVGIQTLNITNATVKLAACNNIVDYIQLHAGGDCIGATPTWTGASKLAFDRNYTLDTTSILWQAGTGNVPHTIDILSGNININTPKTVVTRMQLLGGTVYGGTKLIFANNSYMFRCGGILNQPASMGTNVTVEMCSDTNSNNPPAVIGTTDMPAGGFTGDLIISTNVVLGGNVVVPTGKVVVTSTGTLNDSNFTVNSATSVTVQSGGTIITSKSGGLTGTNSLLGSLPTTLSPTSTTIYNSATGTQTVSSNVTYGNLILTDTAAKVITNATTAIQGNFTVTSGSGAVTAASGSTVVFNGNTNQTISGINFYNVTFDSSGTKTITSTATVTNNLNVPSTAIINTNNNLTLLSGPTGTAQVGPLLNGAAIVGNVCWNRYIPGGPSNRRWRFLSCPLQSVTFRWWQNDIFITGPGTGGTPCPWGTTSTSGMVQNSNGFDQNQSGQYSSFTWNESSATWQTIPSTFNTINPLQAYRTFVRGNRNIEGCILMTNMPDSVSAVTLHSCGPIVQGTQTAPLSFTSGIGNGWNYVSNPYPCTVNWWDPAWVAARSSSINSTIYIWVPELNQYATWNPSAGGTNGGSNLIGTGQSFFIKTSAATNLIFQESYKLDSAIVGFFGKTSGPSVSNNLKIALNVSGHRSDETIVYLQRGATSNYEDTYDGYKMGYTAGSIATATRTNSSKLSFNAIAPVSTTDTIVVYTYLSSSVATSYSLNFNGVSSFDPQYVLILRDKYLSTYTNLLINRTYSFSTSPSVAASYDQNRFEIIFMNSSALPVTLANLSADKQADKTVLVKWSTASEINNSHFILEHSSDGNNFSQLSVIKGAGNSSVVKNYAFVHQNPVNGTNYYRLTQVDFNNNNNQSYVVTVDMTQQQLGNVTLFPVPANNSLNIDFGNSNFAGDVSVKIYDMVGREITNKIFTVNGKNQISTLDISDLMKGYYFVSISSSNGVEQNIKFLKD